MSGHQQSSGGMEAKFRIVVQRCNSASLLLDNRDTWAKIGAGLVVYVSFAKGAREEDCAKVAASILHLPILTSGEWGDGETCRSVVRFCRDSKSEKPPALMVIPQAGLIAKYVSKRLQYQRQADRLRGAKLYSVLCRCLQQAAVSLVVPKHAQTSREGHLARFHERQEAACCPPDEYFRRKSDLYSAFDDQGVPTHSVDGKPLTKSAKKKVMKIYKAQQKKFAKFESNKSKKTANLSTAASSITQVMGSSASAVGPSLSAAVVSTDGGAPTTSVIAATAVPPPAPVDARKSSEEFIYPPGGMETLLPHFVFGTFGNRQALKLESTMGPFTHTFGFG